MPTGRVKWFNTAKGFGYIEGDDGDDVRVYAVTVERSGLPPLQEGQRVACEVGARPAHQSYEGQPAEACLGSYLSSK
ncbi:cold-shock protein [Caulobacter hibisci]|uniref:Cold-shock protein n=2 Tax=Caulobacter hibisci TaxID=2035993 RepID=A0ABS0SY33_9CAUL|nr:cold shock domain-containing protein [Caulobacter hibisci]MBI1684536.1 cold-shock protein [Caulobacter hibisci]